MPLPTPWLRSYIPEMQLLTRHNRGSSRNRSGSAGCIVGVCDVSVVVVLLHLLWQPGAQTQFYLEVYVPY